jgi:hypothetical protein
LLDLGSWIAPCQIAGFEVDDDAADQALRAVPEASIVIQDFFSVPNETTAAFDAVVGNPPYIRYHHFTGDLRSRALQRTLSHGVTLTELSSSWAPFLIHASAFLRPNGRLAFVLPMELLVTDYAGPVRTFLQERFAKVDIVTFEQRVFPGALVDAVLLMAEGIGPGDVRIHRLSNVVDLDRLDLRLGRRTSQAKWSGALIDQRAVDVLAEVPGFRPLGEFASVDIGIVTGANRFFLLSDDEVSRLGLDRSDLQPTVARARDLTGISLRKDDWMKLRDRGRTAWMFAPQDPGDAASRYIAEGEASGVNQGYKCRIRKQWWRLSLPQPPDLVLSYMSNHVPRMIENQAGVVTTNLLHNVRLTSSIPPRWIALSWMNSATMLSCEMCGRAYGGGVLKLETRESERVLVPEFDAGRMAELESHSTTISGLVQEGRFADVADLIDPFVLANIDPDDRMAIRSAWLDLQRRRRGRSSNGK